MDQQNDPSAPAPAPDATPQPITATASGTNVNERYYGAPPYSFPHYPHQPAHLSYAYPPNAPPYGRYPAGPSTATYDAGPSSAQVKLEPMDQTSASPSSQLGTASPSSGIVMRRIGAKSNVSSACAPCKKAHLACDVSRPCKRCVNMGKEALCADVPHKKRGRPKSLKPPLSEPYSRIRPALWRGESMPYGETYSYAYSGDPPIHPGYSLSRSMPNPEPPVWNPPAPFVIFCSTDWRVLRVSPSAYSLTGYRPHDFADMNLLDWFAPDDRAAIDHDRQRLISVPGSVIRTDPEAVGGMMQLEERDLITPAEGMREYPNQNVHLLRADRHYALFNVRLHLGGGLGGTPFRADTWGRIYLVVSLLLIPETMERPPHRASAPPMDDRRYGPPTPMTAMPAGPPHLTQHASSMLTTYPSMPTAESPVVKYETSPTVSTATPAYYAPRAPPVAGPYDYAPHPGSGPAGYHRSPSPRYSAPPLSRSVTGPAGMSINTTHYPGVDPSYPQATPNTGSPYYDSRAQGDFRRPEEWDRRMASQPVIQGGTPVQASVSPVTATAISPVAPTQTPTSATMPQPGSAASQEFGRRTWEL